MRGMVALAVVIAVLAVAGVVAAVAQRGDNERGRSHPKAWDPRVRDLVSFVEKERGLRFDHPVQVDFLPDAEFKKEVTADDTSDEQQREELASTEAILRAVGLVHGNVDLKKIGDQLVGEGVVGLYRFKDQRVLVRGDTLDDLRRATLAHELTHALQDQHFHIGDREPTNSGEDAAFTAVVEADAEDVQDAWRKTLPSDRRAALEKAQQSQSDEADFNGVPDVFVELMSFPYIFGPDFLHDVMDARGRGARDDLLRKPPTTEENIVLPDTYLDGQGARHVDTPPLANGEKVVKDSEGDFGMLSLLVVLAERVSWTNAWDAVQGWAGDATIAFRRTTDTCVRTDVRFDTTAESERFASVFDAWAKGLPAKERRTGSSVRFESCDPGTDTAAPDAHHVSGITGLELRRSIAQEFVSQGAPQKAAFCITDGLLHRLGAQRVADLDQQLAGATPDPGALREVQAAAQASAAACRSA